MEELISPFDNSVRDPCALAPRLAGLEGKRVTLFSISKPRSAEFLDELGRLLREDYGAVVAQAQKPTFASPAPARIVDDVLASSDAVVEALAD